jgi:enolase
MLAPVGAESFSDAVRMCSEVYHTLKNILASEKKTVSVGDEGGFAPDLDSDEEAVKLLIRAIEAGGYRPGQDISIALDAAASEWYSDGRYRLPKRHVSYTPDELCRYFESLTSSYPIISLEDPMGEEDFYGWEKIGAALSDTGINLVGDDLFVTNSERIRRGHEKGIANTVLIKPNQIGTLSETAEAHSTASSLGYKTVISHRSGESEDSFIADLAVAFSSDYVKMGAPARGERTAKYNRLMKIESELWSPTYGI